MSRIKINHHSFSFSRRCRHKCSCLQNKKHLLNHFSKQRLLLMQAHCFISCISGLIFYNLFLLLCILSRFIFLLVFAASPPEMFSSWFNLVDTSGTLCWFTGKANTCGASARLYILHCATHLENLENITAKIQALLQICITHLYVSTHIMGTETHRAYREWAQ